MESEILSPIPLLGPDKSLTEEGWARKPYWQYRQGRHQGQVLSDRYCIADHEGRFMLIVEISEHDHRMHGSVILVDFEKKKCCEEHSSQPVNRKTEPLSSSPDEEHEISYIDERMTIAAVRRSGRRFLQLTAPYLILPSGETGLKAYITLHDGNMESISAAVCQKADRKRWAYSSAVAPMQAEGTLFIAHRKIMLGEGCLGIFSWYRGRLNDASCTKLFLAGETDGRAWALFAAYDEERRIRGNMNCIMADGKVWRTGDIDIIGDGDGWKVCGSGIDISVSGRMRRDEDFRASGCRCRMTEAFGKAAGSIEAGNTGRICFSGIPSVLAWISVRQGADRQADGHFPSF